MFDELVSSRVTRRVTPGRGLVVAALHGMLIAGAIQATAAGPPPPPPVRLDTAQFIYERIEPLPAGPSFPGGGVSGEPVVLPMPPVDVPISIPPVAPGPVLDPARLRQVLGVGRPGPGAVGGDSTALGGILAAAEVDEPAEAIQQPPPRYPPVLQQAGVQGRVLLEFVIDTSGHLEPASLRVLASSNAGFDAAAKETVRRSVFRPARVQGRPVRQRTLQSIAFRITPD